MKLRNFKSLSATSPESQRLFESIKSLLFSRNNFTVDLYKDIHSIQQLSCSSEVKHGNWGIRVLINCTDKSGQNISHDLFVKQTSKISYQSESNGVKNLKSYGLEQFDNILCPIGFFSDRRIIISVYFDGYTLKKNLRKCLFSISYKTRQATFITNCNAIGQWLYSFHNESMSQNNELRNNCVNSHELKNFLFLAKQQILTKQLSNKVIIDDIKSTLDNELDANFIPCTVHGDFGIQNILVRDTQFKIIDWEHSHVGHPFGDCITYTVSILDQSRFSPFGNSFITNAIDSFFDGYLQQYSETDKKLIKNALIILAAHHSIKRDEWARDKRKESYLFTGNRKLLIELISNAYRAYQAARK